ncbi:unnamed protein product [Vitrella brassicaformis CCMP3155]|uniref:Uncharacterized protein n=1 Tax=Vitrella brassicaformis (strain CCMP3155) TaxID=1169540 RepID=A0A0G4E8D7_VITBC|nr:unnamed protein product [Vitrella brassicaformis CCMP3155]|eukprot:CEL91969.1 unnamed protein product [Vitrella brassicaformis CCMP3155]
MVVRLPTAAAQPTTVSSNSAVKPATADSLPYLIVVGVVEQGKTYLSVLNYGSGSVSLTTLDEYNTQVSSATIAQDDSLTRQTPFGASNELTFIFEAANGTEVFRQTDKNDLKHTLDAQQQDVAMVNLKVMPNNALQLVVGNPLAFDLLVRIEHQGERLSGPGRIRPTAESDWMQVGFLRRLEEGDDFYVSLVPKNEADGTSLVAFGAITNWRPFVAQRRRALRRAV